MKSISLSLPMRRAALALGLAAFAFLAPAPALADTKDDIKADMQAGRWPQAEQRLAEVLKKHPDNALAHYWYAQVLEKQGRRPEARAELATAERLAPDEHFAGSKEALAALKQRLAADEPAAARPARPDPVQLPDPAPQRHEEQKSSGGGGLGWIFAVAAVLLVVLVIVSRRSGGAGLKRERERWTAEINDTIKDLSDAQLVSDANPALNDAQRLSNYDRIRLVKNDLSGLLAGMATRSDFSSFQGVLLRARDLAAELRGEERPSERMHRDQQEQLDREAQVAAARGQGAGYGPGYGQPAPGGGGLLRDAAILGGGAVLGSILAGNASAHGRRDDNSQPFDGGSAGSLHIPDDDSNYRFDPGSSGGIDVGGSGDSFDSGGGGADVGGGGGDDFS